MFGEGQDAIVADLTWAGEIQRWWTPSADASGSGIVLDVDQRQAEFHHDAIAVGADEIRHRDSRGRRATSATTPRATSGWAPTGPASVSDDLLIRCTDRRGGVRRVTALSSLLPISGLGSTRST